ncbi:MAG: dienelactone hydrolase family protein [Acidimicrobiia bacterium]
MPAPREYPFTHDGLTRDVLLIDGPGPRVVLLHEVGGVSRACLDFADALAGDFQVHIPVLHGYPGQVLDGTATGTKDPLSKARFICIRREFAMLSAGRSSPISGWLRALCRHVAEGTPGAVGVIGMCLTGGLVFSLVLDPSVGAAVASQPSVPLRPKAEQVGAAELGDRQSRGEEAAATGTPVLGLRFSDDGMCPGARLDRIEELYAAGGGRFTRYSPQPPAKDIPGPPDSHAVLTDHADRAPGARGLVRAFLLEHLGTT